MCVLHIGDIFPKQMNKVLNIKQNVYLCISCWIFYLCICFWSLNLDLNSNLNLELEDSNRKENRKNRAYLGQIPGSSPNYSSPHTGPTSPSVDRSGPRASSIPADVAHVLALRIWHVGPSPSTLFFFPTISQQPVTNSRQPYARSARIPLLWGIKYRVLCAPLDHLAAIFRGTTAIASRRHHHSDNE